MSEVPIPPIPQQEAPQPVAGNGGAPEAGRPGRSFREAVRYWLSVIPGTKRDYFLITLGVLDSLVILFSTNLITLFPFVVTSAIVAFDISVVVIWGLFFLHRFITEKDRWSYVSYHWYEVIGLIPIPLSSLRLFLLLRAAKLVIAYYKLGRAEQDVSQLLTRDLTFRFRDAIVDTIADAVFVQSLRRVEEVMSTLDYEQVSRTAMERHREALRATVEQSLSNQSMIGELRKIPLMGGFADRLTKDVGLVVAEILEQKVLGDIMRDVSASVLGAMHTRLRDIGVDRISPLDIRSDAAKADSGGATGETVSAGRTSES
ncbi:MAG: hypothetical protein RIF32_03350, partial [Leptospirales bacterium]